MSTFDTFQDGWAADAFASGAAWGDGVADKVSGMFDFSALDSMGADSLDAFNLGNDLDSIYGNTGDIETTQRPPLMPWILLKKIWPIFVTLRSVKQSTGSLPLKSRLNSTMKTTFPKMLIWMGSWMLGPMTLLKSWKFLKKGCMSNGV